MSIPFTQYLRPDGRRRSVAMDCPRPVEDLAGQLIRQGWVFEAEVLRTGAVSLTVCRSPKRDDEEEGNLAIEVVPNGWEVPLAVERLVRAAAKAAGILA